MAAIVTTHLNASTHVIVGILQTYSLTDNCRQHSNCLAAEQAATNYRLVYIHINYVRSTELIQTGSADMARKGLHVGHQPAPVKLACDAAKARRKAPDSSCPAVKQACKSLAASKEETQNYAAGLLAYGGGSSLVSHCRGRVTAIAWMC
jgi:hypothetical protein